MSDASALLLGAALRICAVVCLLPFVIGGILALWHSRRT